MLFHYVRIKAVCENSLEMSSFFVSYSFVGLMLTGLIVQPSFVMHDLNCFPASGTLLHRPNNEHIFTKVDIFSENSIFYRSRSDQSTSSIRPNRNVMS